MRNFVIQKLGEAHKTGNIKHLTNKHNWNNEKTYPDDHYSACSMRLSKERA